MGLTFSPVRPRVCSAKRTPFFFSLADRPHYRLPGYASKRSLIGPSARLTIGPALCSAGRPIRSFRPGGNSRRCFSSLRPGAHPAHQPFSPLAPLVFSTARVRRVFSGFLYAGVIGGFWVAAPPYPSAPCRPPIFSVRAPVSMLNKQEPLAALCLQPRHE